MGTSIKFFSLPEHMFLCSYYMSAPLLIDGITFSSVHQAFFAKMTDDTAVKKQLAELTEVQEIRSLGLSLIKRKHTKQWQLGIMTELINMKFDKYPHLAEKLKATGGDTELENNLLYKDTFWGKFKGKGENQFGKLQMAKRTKLLMPKTF